MDDSEASGRRAVTLHFSEPIVRGAVRAYWWRSTGWSFFVAPAVLLAGFAVLLVSGDRSWIVGVLGTIIVLCLAVAAVLYVVHYRRSIARFRRMRDPVATFEIGEQTFTATSDVGSSELAWKTVTEVWRLPTCWLLFFAPGQFTTLPLADLDDEARTMILDRVRSAGGRIR